MAEKKIKILIVDDDEITRAVYAEVFRKEQFAVLEAVDGLEGLDMATKEMPDVIFTGIIMPRMDGFALMEALKKNVATSRIPVLISSHLGREEDQKKANELGAKDFIVRGFYTPNEVVERVKALFNLGEYRLRINITAPDAQELAKDMHIDEKFLCEDCGGELVLALKFSDLKNHVFSARFVCSKCGKAQN